jgi:putative phosphoribosyl transferase
MSCERIQPHLGVSRGHEMKNKFDNRAHAGRLLARQLAALALHQPVVVALPRGGVPVAAEVAAALRAPLDVLLVQKIGAPTQPEVAVAAMSDGAEPHLEFDEETLAQSGTSRDDVLARASQHLQEIERRRALYLEGRPPLDIKGRTVVLVDDGVATGTTVRAGIRALRERKPRRVVLAVPVAPASALPALRALVDDLVCIYAPEFFGAVSLFYEEFEQTSDEEVVALLRAHRPERWPAED